MSDNKQDWGWARRDPDYVPPEIDTSKPSVARVYDYFLGGKDNFAVDRQVAEMVLKTAPDASDAGRANRAFLQRAVRFMAAEAGIRQFIDIGSGLPTQGNVHEVAQAVDSEARIVYVDNDPIVLAHGQALLATNGSTTVIQADLRDPEAILGHPDLRRFIDFDQPVGLLLLAILHHIRDDEDPAGLAARLLAPLPSGSYLVISHFHNPGEEHPDASAQALDAERIFNESLGCGRWRTREEILGYFSGTEILEPGLVPLAEWRAQPDDFTYSGITYHTFVGAVGRKN
ncbi:SAM-dependent methyltransferase [Streptosporangium sp. NPDC049644]|uniref:SAM-dependent methyltransferase n=1 Tax=Streptosporangium sp. NPDC049644 TaxID=3155507 RepID=UPI00341743A3